MVRVFSNFQKSNELLSQMDRSQSVFSGAVQPIFVDIQRSLDSSRHSLNSALKFAPRIWFDPLAEHVESPYPITTQNALQWLFRTYQTLESIVPFVHRIGEFHLAAFDTNSVSDSTSLGNIIPHSPCICNAASTTRSDLLNESPHQLGSPLDAQCLLIDIQTLDRILKCICPHVASLCRFEHNQSVVFCQYFEFQHQNACNVLTDRCFRRVKATLQALERSNGIVSSVPMSFLLPATFDPIALNFSSTRLLSLLNGSSIVSTLYLNVRFIFIHFILLDSQKLNLRIVNPCYHHSTTLHSPTELQIVFFGCAVHPGRVNL
jgi:hypothetical protein